MNKIEELKRDYGQRVANAKYSVKGNGEAGCHPDLWLFSKFAYRIPQGWYGFALGKHVPFVWAQVIEDYLHYLGTKCPKYEIHQIKLKFGGLRFYVELNAPNKATREEIHKEIAELEEWLQHEKLVY